jgi:succinoglycan biosynthesis transport protein ExoP
MTGPNANAPRPRPTAAPASFPVLRWLALHWLTILFCGTLLGSGLAYAAWTLLPAKAESYALLQVASSPSYVANANDPQRAKTDFITYLKTTAKLIKSHDVMNRALNDQEFGVAKLEVLRNEPDPFLFLDENVQVTFQEGNEIITVGMKSENSENAQKIVNAVVKAYLKQVVEREVLRKKELLESVRYAKVELTSAVKRKGGTVESPLGTAGASPPPQPLPGAVVSGQTGGAIPALPQAPAEVKPVGGIAGNVPVIGEGLRRSMADQLMKKIAEYEDQLVYLPGVIRDRERKRDQIKKNIDKVLNEPAKEDALAAAEKDTEVAVLRSEAKRARSEYAHYKSLAANPDAPSVLAFKERADLLDLQADQKKAVKAKELESARRVAAGSVYDQQLADSEREITRLKEQAEVATVLRDRARDELAKLPPEILKDEVKGPNIDPAKTDLVAHNVLLDRVTQQEIGLDFELTAPPRVSVIQNASTAMVRDIKKQVIVTVVAGLFGFALCGLIAVGYEAKVRKVSALTDLAAATGMPAAAVIPHPPTTGTYRDPLKRADVEEAVDKLRTFVTQAWLPCGVKTIAVTSPVGDEGKAATSVGLAESLAKAGIRCLLVDFDLRMPAVHRLTQLDNQRGVCELLRGEVQPGDAVVGMPSGLYVLPAGTWTEATRHCAAGDRLKSLFEILAQPFDCLVVHAHSLLTAAESVEVARRADAVLLCTQYRDSRMPLVTRAAERLATMGAAKTGLVYVGATPQESLC